MRQFILLVLLGFSLAFTSCDKKEDPIYQAVEEVKSDTLSLYGEWILVSGKLYVENLETGENTVYDHFDASKTTSSLRYSGVLYEFERLEVDVTTWTFIQPINSIAQGEFWLNGDDINPYGLNIVGNMWTITEHASTTSSSDMKLGGSSRPITAVIIDYKSKIVEFTVQDAYESIDGYNCNTFSKLRFQKVR